MSATKRSRQTVSIVGPGRLGTALAINLHRAGWPVRFIALRAGKPVSSASRRLARKVGAKVVRLGEASLPKGLVWITVPDGQISVVAEKLAASQDWRGWVVFHSSGALTSDELAPLREKGAKVASVHPGMTFVHRSVPTLQGVPFGIEGDVAAVRLGREVIASTGAVAVEIPKANKVLYHAFDAFASPLLIALMAALEEVGRAADIKPRDLRAMAGPLLQQTLKNYLKHGAAAAFSGPFVRGDVAVIERHLAALERSPISRDAYVALARVAVAKLPAKNREALKKLLRKDK